MSQPKDNDRIINAIESLKFVTGMYLRSPLRPKQQIQIFSGDKAKRFPRITDDRKNPHLSRTLSNIDDYEFYRTHLPTHLAFLNDPALREQFKAEFESEQNLHNESSYINDHLELDTVVKRDHKEIDITRIKNALLLRPRDASDKREWQQILIDFLCRPYEPFLGKEELRRIEIETYNYFHSLRLLYLMKILSSYVCDSAESNLYNPENHREAKDKRHDYDWLISCVFQAWLSTGLLSKGNSEDDDYFACAKGVTPKLDLRQLLLKTDPAPNIQFGDVKLTRGATTEDTIDGTGYNWKKTWWEDRQGVFDKKDELDTEEKKKEKISEDKKEAMKYSMILCDPKNPFFQLNIAKHSVYKLIHAIQNKVEVGITDFINESTLRLQILHNHQNCQVIKPDVQAALTLLGREPRDGKLWERELLRLAQIICVAENAALPALYRFSPLFRPKELKNTAENVALVASNNSPIDVLRNATPAPASSASS